MISLRLIIKNTYYYFSQMGKHSLDRKRRKRREKRKKHRMKKARHRQLNESSEEFEMFNKKKTVNIM